MSRYEPYEIPEEFLTEPPGNPVFDWLREHGGMVIASLPSIIVASTWFCLMFGVTQTRDGRVAQYLAMASQDVEQGKYEDARLCLDRVIRLGSGTDPVLIDLSKVLKQLGQDERASVVMESIASLESDSAGSQVAHLEMARTLMADPKHGISAQRAAEQHLLKVLEVDPNSRDTHALLGKLYTEMKRYSEARAHYLEIIVKRPDVALDLAQAYLGEGDEMKALNSARRALVYWKDRCQTVPDDEKARLEAVASALFLKDFEQAETLLKEGLELADSEKLSQALANTYAAWAGSLSNTHKEQAEAISLLENGLRQDPRNPSVLTALSKVLQDGGTPAESVQSLLLKLVDEPHTASSAHFLLGQNDFAQGRVVDARGHLEKVYELAPQSAETANLLARALSTEPGADPSRALKIIDLALQNSPSNPELRLTRGHMYAQAGNWKEAVADLESALPVVNERVEVLLEIAKGYDALGMPEIATRYRVRAETIEAEHSPAIENP